MQQRLCRINHSVPTVDEILAICHFYDRFQGMEVVTFGEDRKALRFGQLKDQPAPVGKGIRTKGSAPHAHAGSADPCFSCGSSLAVMQQHPVQQGVPTVEGPVGRTGATDPIQSLYFRGPDDNLIEVAVDLPVMPTEDG